MENTNMESKKKNGLIVPIVILTILVVVLGGYIGYDKFLSKNTNNTTEESSKNENNIENEIENTEKDKDSQENNNYIKTRICTGIYSGTAALAQDIMTGEYENGTLTIELKSDGTYDVKKENMNGFSGEYTIIDNTLLLKTSPDTCGPGADCSAKYSQYLSISDDCSSILGGYGSYFFNPSFTLNKQN